MDARHGGTRTLNPIRAFFIHCLFGGVFACVVVCASFFSWYLYIFTVSYYGIPIVIIIMTMSMLSTISKKISKSNKIGSLIQYEETESQCDGHNDI